MTEVSTLNRSLVSSVQCLTPRLVTLIQNPFDVNLTSTRSVLNFHRTENTCVRFVLYNIRNLFAQQLNFHDKDMMR